MPQVNFCASSGVPLVILPFSWLLAFSRFGLACPLNPIWITNHLTLCVGCPFYLMHFVIFYSHPIEAFAIGSRNQNRRVWLYLLNLLVIQLHAHHHTVAAATRDRNACEWHLYDLFVIGTFSTIQINTDAVILRQELLLG